MTQADTSYSLTFVMPVFNEEQAITGVIESWIAELDRCGVSAIVHVYDDGSQDGVPAVLDALAARIPNLRVTHKTNSGHGPTVLRGYREATTPWIFQMDSDDEMGPEGFQQLWERRESFDLLLGIRTNRRSSAVRRLITKVAKVTVAVFYGSSIEDVNTPYRLIRADRLREVLPLIPEDTFAPNIVMVGFALRRKWRIFQAPVQHRGRRTGTVSIVKWRLWRAAIKAFVQTVRLAFR